MKRFLTAGLCAGSVLLLAWFSFNLAALRIYQVDECQNVCSARILVSGHSHEFFTSVSPFLLALGWMGQGVNRTADLLAMGRCAMLLLFWVNWILIATATGQRLFSRAWWVALAGAATLAPIWDFGFEIRHDNIILTGILVMWCVVRVSPSGLLSYFMAGAIPVLLQSVSLKGFVYSVPICFVFLVFPPPGYSAARWKLILAWVTGVVGMVAAIYFSYKAAGYWEVYVSDWHRVSGHAGKVARVWPWQSLARLLTQTPLLLALAIAGLAAIAGEVVARRKLAFHWEGALPEAFLTCVGLGALLINPAPFPYNLMHPVAFGFIFVFRYFSSIFGDIWKVPSWRLTIITVLIFAHLVPFEIATHRHWRWTNFRQELLMRTAEDLTDPANDSIYNGIGIVATRPQINYRWFLEAMNLNTFNQGAGTHVRDMLAASPSAVVIPNYRTDWLPDEDHTYISEHYVSLADDFWVLGKILPKGGGTIEITKPGRYRISAAEASDISGTYAEPKSLADLLAAPPPEPPPLVGTIDGVPLTVKPVFLSAGTHQIECSPDRAPAAVWTGPHLDRIGKISQHDHRLLFVNWY